ncbi:ABC transporter permease [Brevibacillus sp. B_LB10_24]|uniref:ABC transporter permease n=1 Tax=Brevibacillus sp. B_LB10_24 TaxID=3380645 RepID=UPI0038BDA0D5
MEYDMPASSTDVSIHGSRTETKKKQLKRWLQLLFQSKTGTVGAIITLIVCLVGIFAPQISPYTPDEINPAHMLVPPFWVEGGTSEHILGTDQMGRDIVSRIIYGTQISLLVGVCSVVLSGLIGLFIGLISGYYGKWIDIVSMRLVDAFLAIPNILFTLVVLGVVGPGVVTLIFVIGVTNWVSYARIVRGEVLSIKEREFVKAARTIGVSNRMIIMRHIFPNILSSFIVISTLTVATTILLEASLSFLGLGIQPPTVSWGGMLSDGRNYLATNWWLATFPGLAITFTVLGIIFLGDWLRDILDPHSQGRDL